MRALCLETYWKEGEKEREKLVRCHKESRIQEKPENGWVLSNFKYVSDNLLKTTRICLHLWVWMGGCGFTSRHKMTTSVENMHFSIGLL